MQKTQKITYLEGIRGLSAFVVVLHHFILAFYPALFFGMYATAHLPAGWEIFASGTTLNVFYNGNFGVCIFFILSGFVLSYKFFQQGQCKSLLASAFKRYFRLMPPVFLVVMLSYFLMKYGLYFNQQAGDAAGSGWLQGFWNFVPNFNDALNQALWGTFLLGTYHYDNVIWTITYEFLGAFIILGSLAIFGKFKYRYVIYFLLAIAFFQTYYLAFILGMLLSDLKVNYDGWLARIDKTKILRVILLIVGVIFGAFPSGREATGSMYQYLHFMDHDLLPMWYHIAGAFLVMTVLLDFAWLQNIFSHRSLLWLGKVSYSMYLLHFVIMGTISSFIFLKLFPLLPYFWAVLMTFILSLPIIFIISYLSQRFVENFSWKLSEFVYQKIFRVSQIK